MPEKWTPAEVSRLTFMAIEDLSMWADVVKIRTGKEPSMTLDTIARLKEYRADHGWNANGFGREA
jgi:hypothetical protein